MNLSLPRSFPIAKAALAAAVITCAFALACSLIGCASGGTDSSSADAGNTSASTDGKTLRVGMEAAYAPYNWQESSASDTTIPIENVDGAYADGYDVQVAKKIADALGMEPVAVKMEFGSLVDSLVNGQIDIICAGMSATDERKQSVDFSDAYAMAQLAILANADSGVASIDDLNQPGKKVAVKTGSTGDVYATKNLTNAEIVRLADESACVTEVVQGKADGFLYDQLTIYRNHQANPDTTEAVFIPFQDAEEWGIAVKKGNTELLDQLNAFIAQSKTDGEFDRLTEKYLADEKKAFDQYGFKWFFDFE